MAIDFGIVAERLALQAYQWVFGSDFTPDAEGLQYWKNRILSGDLPLNKLTTAVAEAAGRPDPSVNNILMTDPSYAAFLRQNNLEQSQIENRLASVKDRLSRDRAIADSNFADRLTQDNRGTDISFEDRGLYRSGARLEALSRNTAEVDRARAEYGRQQADALKDAETQAAEQLAERRRQQVEQQTATRTRLTQEQPL